MNRSIFKAADIRGLYPSEINTQVAEIAAQACIRMLPEGEIVVAHDIRYGSVELSETIASMLESEAKNLGKNISVRRIGLSSTPMFYFLVNHFNAVGGCMITASHNPKEYNGIKMVGKNADTISGLAILKSIEDNALATITV